MTTPLVCICIPNLNNEETLPQTLDSILNQTYKNIIVKVVDNCSSDSSVSILKEYEKKYSNLKIYINDSTVSGEENFTKCIGLAEGDFTAIYHSDDVYDSCIVEKQVKAFEANQDVVAISTAANAIDEKGVYIKRLFVPYGFKNKAELFFDDVNLFKEVVRYGNFIVCPTVMSRTSVLKNDIVRWDGKTYSSSADLDVWLRLASFGRFMMINEPLINYRISTASFSFHANKSYVVKHDLYKVLESYTSKFSKHLSQDDKRYIEFSLFRDRVSRVKNLILLKRDVPYYLLKMDFWLIASCRSRLHLKYFFAGVFFNMIRFLPKKVSEKIVSLLYTQHG